MHNAVVLLSTKHPVDVVGAEHRVLIGAFKLTHTYVVESNVEMFDAESVASVVTVE